MAPSNLVLLGYANKPHGLKGHAIFVLPSGKETHLQKGHSVTLKPEAGSDLPKEGRDFVIAEIKKGNDVLVKLEGIEDRTALEPLLPFEIFCDRSQFPKLPEGEFYIADLMGLKVITEEGKVVGKLASHYESAAQVIFTIRFNNGTELDLPYIKKFFPKVDLAAGTVEVLLPEIIE